ncbi:MAG: hypothetical protein M1839_003975, partial [Geoglossum umbratile]
AWHWDCADGGGMPPLEKLPPKNPKPPKYWQCPRCVVEKEKRSPLEQNTISIPEPDARAHAISAVTPQTRTAARSNPSASLPGRVRKRRKIESGHSSRLGASANTAAAPAVPTAVMTTTTEFLLGELNNKLRKEWEDIQEQREWIKEQREKIEKDREEIRKEREKIEKEKEMIKAENDPLRTKLNDIHEAARKAIRVKNMR